MLEIKTQAQLDEAIKDGISEVRFVAKGIFEIHCKNWLQVYVSAELKYDVSLYARGSSRVVAWESSHVVAWESSSVVARESSSVVARGSSSVEAWGSSSVEAWGSSHVVAWESSSVEAWESSSVVARESSSVEAKGYVSLSLWGKSIAKLSVSCHAFIHSNNAKATGGKTTKAIIDTPKKWCEYYGITVKAGLALLYKGVNEDYSSNYDKNFKYTPGTLPEAMECDDYECSKGLHFSPYPKMTLQFHTSAKKFIACWVKISDMKIHPEGSYPNKCKAKKVAKPCFEVNIDGEKV